MQGHDYTAMPMGPARFIPVKQDADRIPACFLELIDGKVVVNDILQERQDGRWSMRIGSYEKLRLTPAAVSERFAVCGLRTSIRSGRRGLTMLVAEVARTKKYAPL